MRKCVYILFLLFSAFQIWGQDVRFTVSSPTTVAVGQRFQISFNVNTQNVRNFKAPTFKGLDILSGPSQSVQSSYSYVNGVGSQSVNVSLSYVVAAPNTGNYNIGKASIEANGTVYESDAFTIRADKSAQPQQQRQGGAASASSANAPQQQNANASPKINDNDLYIKATVSNANPYIGEQVIVTYKIYTSINVARLNFVKTPSNKGFWLEDLTENANIGQQREVINGKQYVVAEIRRIAIFPQEIGKISIEPMEVEALAQVRVQQQRRAADPFSDPFAFFDDAFFNPVVQVQKVLKSNTLTLNVKELPEAGKPLSFSGNVGHFDFKTTLDKTKLKANEALTYKAVISGSGNIGWIEKPSVEFPSDFDAYDPRTQENIVRSAGGLSGSRSFEYLLVPRTQGQYTIPAAEFSYFDPSSKKYVTLTAPEYNITVDKGDGKAPDLAGLQKKDYRNRDIEYIKTKNLHLTSVDAKLFFLSPLFWGLLALPLILFVFFFVWNKRRIAQQSDVVGMRNRKALKEAQKCLRKAETFLQDNQRDAFYIEISQALWGFLSQKFNIPVADLSIESVHNALVGKQITPELIDQFIATLNDCEFARFAPTTTQKEDMQKIYDEALDIIYKIVKELKS